MRMGFSRLRDRLEDDDAGQLKFVATHATRIDERPLNAERLSLCI